MQEEPAPQVTPTHNDKTEQAAAKQPPSAADAALTQHQSNTKSPAISKSSDNTRDRKEVNSPKRPKSRAKHNPQDQPHPEDSKMAAVPQKKEPLPTSKETTTLKHPQPDDSKPTEAPQKKAPTPSSPDTIIFKRMEGGSELLEPQIFTSQETQ